LVTEVWKWTGTGEVTGLIIEIAERDRKATVERHVIGNETRVVKGTGKVTGQEIAKKDRKGDSGKVISLVMEVGSLRERRVKSLD